MNTVSITEEKDRYYGSQRMLHWKDEAAFFRVLMKRHEYFFGGVVDLEMEVSVQRNDKTMNDQKVL